MKWHSADNSLLVARCAYSPSDLFCNSLTFASIAHISNRLTILARNAAARRPNAKANTRFIFPDLRAIGIEFITSARCRLLFLLGLPLRGEKARRAKISAINSLRRCEFSRGTSAACHPPRGEISTRRCPLTCGLSLSLSLSLASDALFRARAHRYATIHASDPFFTGQWPSARIL